MTGKPLRDLALYSEVVERIRESDTDVILNLTTGMGGDLFLGPDDDPVNFSDDTDCVGQVERMEHVEALLPEICSLDCGSFNYMGKNYVYVSTQTMLELGAKRAATDRRKARAPRSSKRWARRCKQWTKLAPHSD